MREAEKLVEAQHFLDRMKQAEAEGNETVFRHELSAFLSAGRSVLQYALIAAQKQGRQSWYEASVKRDECIAFLKEERDTNIHSDLPALSTAEAHQRGPVLGEVELSTVERQWFLWGWQGAEDAVGLGERYLRNLQEIVLEGRAQGILRG